MAALRYSSHLLRHASRRAYSANAAAPNPGPTGTTATSPFAPRHLLSIADLTPTELSTLVRNASTHKQAALSGHADAHAALRSSLAGQTVAMPFSKRSTRTRVSTEAAVARMGGHAMFLGAADIQLGVNESVRDTAVVISSMVAAIVARVGPHADVAALAAHSSVPVINALSDAFHPLQAIADVQTIFEDVVGGAGGAREGLGLGGLRIAWVGDANNVLFDLAIAAGKLGAHVAVATPKGFEIPSAMLSLIEESAADAGLGSTIEQTNVPEEAVKNADVIVTDTWVSMGQEAETAERLRQFAGYQVTMELAKRGGAKENWKFMHCLPRHPEEVSDEVFYNPQRSLVFPEAANRLWAALTALESFVVRKGKIDLV